MRDQACHGFYEYHNGEIICKHLWDFVELLIIPLALTSITIIITHFWKRKDSEAMLENQREDLLQQYFKETKELILEKELLNKSNYSPESVFANVLTINLLKRLDGYRKGFVLTFLTNTKLIVKKKPGNQSRDNTTPPIYLKDADFSDVEVERYTTFVGINMTSAIFRRSKLEYSAFLGCVMSGANFSGSLLGGCAATFL